MITATRSAPADSPPRSGGPACDPPERLRSALASFPAGAALLAREPLATLLKAGRTGDTWRVRSAGEDWAVRLGHGERERLAVDYRREAAHLSTAAGGGFAPPTVHVAPARGLLVTRFVACDPLSAAAARHCAFVYRLAERLRALHALPVAAAGKRLDLAGVLAHYAALAPPAHAPVPRAAVTRTLARMLPRYRPSAEVALCHNDLHRANVLATDPLLFIDWEYADFGDPWLDLAAYAAYEELDGEGRRALLAGYGADARDGQQHLAVAMTLFDCLRVLWTDAADGWAEVPEAVRGRLAAQLQQAEAGAV